MTDGVGLVQSRGEDVTPFGPGEVIVTPPDEWHWHGAAPDHFMAHISMTEGVGEGRGPEANWGSLVTDAQYRGEENAR